MSVNHVRVASRRTTVVAHLIVASAVAAISSSAMGQVSAINLDFNGAGGGFANTGFDAAYNPDPSGYNLNFSGNGKLGILTLPGDIYGAYEGDPDNAKNMFYSNFNVGDRAVAVARVNAINLNENFHGGGIWMGTDQDHYVRLGLVNNSFEGGVTVEALRENEDRWTQDGLYPNRPGFDIESRNTGVNASSTATVGGAANGRDITAILKLVRDHHAVACYFSLDNGVTFTRAGGAGYSFNALSTDATTLPIDNRTAADPNNTDKTSHTVEGGFKIGAYAFGGGASQAVLQFDSLTAVTGTPTYTGAAAGDWTDDTNWSNNNGIGAPTNIESTAIFPTAAQARSINVPSDITATNIRFDSAAGTSVIGNGNITLDWFYFPSHPDYYTDGPGTVKVTAGNHTISAPISVAHLHNFDIAPGTSLTLTQMNASPAANTDAGIHKLNTGTLNVNRLVTPNIVVDAGTLKISPNGTLAATSTVRNITIATTSGSTAKLDITNNAVVQDYDVAPATSPIAATAALIKSGYAGGAWTGPGITSSNAAADTKKAIGYAEASDLGASVPSIFGTVDATAVLLRYTFKGDATLDGAVNFSDLVLLAQNYNLASGAVWHQGDFNYDGKVDFGDLVSLAQNYNQTSPFSTSQINALGGESFLSDWKLAQAVAPEPTSLAMIGLVAGVAMRRRKA